MVYFQKTDALIEYLQSKQLLEVTLNGNGNVDTDYKLILSKAMAASKQYDVKHWMADLSHKRKVPIDDTWISNYLLPNIIEAGLIKLAFVMHADFDKDEACVSIKELENNPGLPLRFFVNKEEAYKWLNN
jgi:hypothetical protein